MLYYEVVLNSHGKLLLCIHKAHITQRWWFQNCEVSYIIWPDCWQSKDELQQSIEIENVLLTPRFASWLQEWLPWIRIVAVLCSSFKKILEEYFKMSHDIFHILPIDAFKFILLAEWCCCIMCVVGKVSKHELNQGFVKVMHVS